MAKHFPISQVFSYLQRGFFPISSFAIIRKSSVFCTIAKMVCHRHCTMFSVMFQTKTWLKAERGTTSQEQIEKWSCLSSNGPLNVLLIISISAELLLLCTLWGQIFFEVTIDFLHYCQRYTYRVLQTIQMKLILLCGLTTSKKCSNTLRSLTNKQG